MGQEIVERIRSRGAVHRMFTGFNVTGPLPAVELKLHIEGKDVGEITSVASLPSRDGEARVALGYVRREKGDPGTELEADSSKLSATGIPFQIFES